MPLFETRQLAKFHRAGQANEVRALDGVSLTIDRGAFAVLTGPSGSGKTTLLSLLGCLDRPTRGEIWFDERSLAGAADVELARVRRQLGFVFQDFALLPKLSLVDNIVYPLIPRGGSRTQRRATALELLDRLGMKDQAAKRPEELSGGERQRVALARALAGEPAAILADEPTSNLDPATSRRAVEILREFHAAGKTLIISTHDPAVLALATQVFTLDRGKLAQNLQGES